MSAIGAISAITAIPGIGGSSAIGGTSAIAGTSSIGGSNAVDGTAGAAQTPGNSFLNSLNDAFGSLNGQLNSADTAMADFASGGSADLHTVMLQMEEASISLKTATTVRDKLLEAYQEIMRTQL
jgi:flagellar hook-basal body complex protein FliE